MPYLSMAQARRFHADPKLRKYTKEYDAATNFASLPDRVHPPKMKPKHRAKMLKDRATAITRMLAAGGNHR